MKLNQKSKLMNKLALVLLVSMVYQIFFPAVSLALTSGTSSPEVAGHQPVDATDNVNLVTGAFNYTIPITSVPEYPMAYGYSPGGGMDHDASAFGFDGNSFPGSIRRDVVALPDDIKGGSIEYKMTNQTRWGVSLGASVGIIDILPEEVGVDLGANAGLDIGYDNYDGMFGAISAGISVGVEEKNDVSLNLGFTSDSRSIGLSSNVGISFNQFFAGVTTSPSSDPNKKNETRVNLGVSINKRKGENSVGAAVPGAALGVSLGSDGVSTFAYPTLYQGNPGANTLRSPAAGGVVATSNGFGVNVTVPLPITPPTSVNASYYRFAFGNETKTSNGYGYMHLANGYDRKNYVHQADFYIHKNDPKPNLNPIHMGKDFFTVTGQGVGGSMKMYAKHNVLVNRSYKREQNRKLVMILPGVKTDRKQTKPWTGATYYKRNATVDVIELLKKKDDDKADSKDVDNVLFRETDLEPMVELTSLISTQKLPEFKMRGDLAGQYNLASIDYYDFEPNGYDLIEYKQPGKRDNRWFFMGSEKKIPAYLPVPNQSTAYKYRQAISTDGKIEKSNYIKYYTIREVLDANMSIHGQQIRTIDVSTAVNETIHKFDQSYYAHYKFADPSYSKTSNVTINNHLLRHNLLQELSAKSNYKSSSEKEEFLNLIGGYEVRKQDGMTYIYNLPVFTTGNKTLYMKGNRKKPPVTEGEEYHSVRKKNGNVKDRIRVEETKDFSYPYAWNLTAVVGPDYIDFDDIPGPSEGDLGYWVKFKYVRAQADYRWRNPYNGMQHMVGKIHSVEDDMYMVTSGSKEVYYLAEVESPGYIAKYTYDKRFDVFEAKGLWNGDAVNTQTQENGEGSYVSPNSLPLNPTGDDYLFAASSVKLYKKHYSGTNSSIRNRQSEFGKLIRATEFKYDYSICPQTLSNLANYQAVFVDDLSYHINQGMGNPNDEIQTGKLTLRKIQHLAYDEQGNEVKLPPYNFQYGFDQHGEEEYNPSYNPKRVDQWGNYMQKAKDDQARSRGGDLSGNEIHMYSNYTEIDVDRADLNAQAFKVSKINLPSGGNLQVTYEANAYAKVQDKDPFVMRNIKQIISEKPDLDNFEDPLNVDYRWLEVDVSDLQKDNKNLADLLSPGDELYGEVAYYINNNSEESSEEDIYLSIDTVNYVRVVTLPTLNQSDNRYYQIVKVKRKKQGFPFQTRCEQFMLSESDQVRAIKQSRAAPGAELGCIASNILLNNYESGDKDNPIRVSLKIVSNLYSAFNPVNKSDFEFCYGEVCKGDNLYPHQSYLRTKAYKAKYTGSRVKQIAFNDAFQYATQSDGSYAAMPNRYATNYIYETENKKREIISSGVATIEPGGGAICVIDVYKSPLGGFYTGPAILQGKTTVETDYESTQEDVNEGNRLSRRKGKTIYEYFTPSDEQYIIAENLKAKLSKIQISMGMYFQFGILACAGVKKPKWLRWVGACLPYPLTIISIRSNFYAAMNYRYVDLTDMYGQPKSVKQIAANGEEVASQNYTYFDPAEPLRIVNGDFGDSGKSRLGRIDQVWTEAYLTQKDKIFNNYISNVNIISHKFFKHINIKETYVPPVLKKITSTVDGLTTTTEYNMFDFYTGQPLEVRSKDSYGNTKIQRTEPAYWHNQQMGPRDDNASYANMLTQTTGNYLYLNQVDNDHLLGVGITEWDADNWRYGGIYLKPTKTYVDQDNFQYQYALVNTDQWDGLVNDGNGGDLFAKKNDKLYREYETYVYETDVDEDGTFAAGYTPFLHGTSSQSGGWKRVNTNELFDHTGHLVQSRDVLDKYAAAHFGYNQSNAISSAGNAVYKATVFEGGENTYQNGGETYLEGRKVTLESAQVIEAACDKVFVDRVLDYNQLVGNHRTLEIIPPSNINNIAYNERIARINAIYYNGVQRSLFITVKDDGHYAIYSDLGERFDGFFEVKGTNGKVDLVFESNDFNVFVIHPSAVHPNYTVTDVSAQPLPVCSSGNKNYQIPDNTCVSEVHTGKYGFLLPGQREGTRFAFTRAELPAGEFDRAYEAMVWVHRNSVAETQLVMEVTGGSSITKTTTLATPYVTAGNWSLLRVEATRAEMQAANTLVVKVVNPSTGGVALYDDLRVKPYHASMENFVYQHPYARVSEKLNNDHFATYYEYDTRGRLTDVKTEVQDVGKQTVKKYLYNDQKKTQNN